MRKMFVAAFFAASVALGACAHEDDTQRLLVQQLQAKCAQRGQTFLVDDAPKDNAVVSGKCVGGTDAGTAPPSTPSDQKPDAS